MTTHPATTKRILNCEPSKQTENDWRLRNAVVAGLVQTPQAGGAPQRVDLRESWWTIGDQGQTGSCVGWASADSVVRWHMVKSERITTTDVLSPRFVWMAAKETDEFRTRPTTFIEADGTSLKAALDVVRRYGCVRDEFLPFQSGALYQEEAESFYALASRLRISGYYNLSLSRGHQLGAWKFWLANVGPLLARLDVDDTFMDATSTDGQLATYHPASAFGGHAVALVGYTADHFIVRNSWGTEWGDKGFAYASMSYAAVAFTEVYGVRVA